MQKPVVVDFGKFEDLIKENTGPDKKLLMLEEGFIVSEFDLSITEAKNVLHNISIPCSIVGDGVSSYLAVADTKEKIDQYLDSKIDNEYEAIFVNVGSVTNKI